MAFPRALSPGFWLDKILRIFLNLVLAIMLHVLYSIKGEKVYATKVEVTVKNVSKTNNNNNDNKTIEKNIKDIQAIKNNMTKPIDVFNNPTVEIFSEKNNVDGDDNDNSNNIKNEIITGTLTELKSDENLIEEREISILNTINNIIIDDNKSDEEKEESQSSIGDDNDSVEEEEEPIHNIVPSEMKTSHINTSDIMKNSSIIPFEFHWEHDCNRVFVTGDFDGWSGEHEMTRIPKTNDFVAIIDIDCTKQHEFKFIVDGEWKVRWDLQTHYDGNGNINNIIHAVPTSDSLNTGYNNDVGFFNSHLTAAY